MGVGVSTQLLPSPRAVYYCSGFSLFTEGSWASNGQTNYPPPLSKNSDRWSHQYPCWPCYADVVPIPTDIAHSFSVVVYGTGWGVGGPGLCRTGVNTLWEVLLGNSDDILKPFPCSCLQKGLL